MSYSKIMLRSVVFLKNIHFNNNRNFRKFSGTVPAIFHEEVKYGLEHSLPIVALESTIVTHGMPYPGNIQCALEVEEEIRKKGAIPATIAILGGKIRVGLTGKEISELGDIKVSAAVKTSRRDLSYVVSNKLNGGTTVSGTLIIAQKAKIPIFATGGLGGVHREGEKTFDISADLIELGKTSVAVFSSGIKSILDIPKTLEYLETQGVFVATFGPTKDFPGFYCARSGYSVPYNINSAEEAALIIRSNKELNLNSGMVFGVPVPDEYSLDKDELNAIIKEALKLAEDKAISGKDITPFLLSRVADATKGKSLMTNIALVKNNASVAANVAIELSRLAGSCGGSGCRPDITTRNEDNERNLEKRPVVIGGCILDRCATLNETDIKLDGRIHNVKFTQNAGGVARNIVDALNKLNCPPIFLSAIGEDYCGRIVTSQFPWKVKKHIRRVADHSTAQCVIVLDAKGECKFLLGDVEIHKKITPDFIRKHEKLIQDAPLLILDGNPTIEAMQTALEIADKYEIPVLFEPTDVVISEKPFHTRHWKAIKYVSPNINELKHIAKIFAIPIIYQEQKAKVQEIIDIVKLLANYIDNIIVTLGADGLLIARFNDATDIFLSSRKRKNLQLRHYPAISVPNIVSVSGAGDCLISGMITSMLKGFTEEQCVAVGLKAATTSLQSFSAVPEEFLFNDTEKISPAKYIQIF